MLKNDFRGDFCQLIYQVYFLAKNGFDLEFHHIYPYVKTEEEYEKALRLIFDEECDGWWHYLEYYKKFEICTEEEFNIKLNNI
jgi:hypothetical protein